MSKLLLVLIWIHSWYTSHYLREKKWLLEKTDDLFCLQMWLDIEKKCCVYMYEGLMKLNVFDRIKKKL